MTTPASKPDESVTAALNEVVDDVDGAGVDEQLAAAACSALGRSEWQPSAPSR